MWCRNDLIKALMWAAFLYLQYNSCWTIALYRSRMRCVYGSERRPPCLSSIRKGVYRYPNDPTGLGRRSVECPADTRVSWGGEGPALHRHVKVITGNMGFILAFNPDLVGNGTAAPAFPRRMGRLRPLALLSRISCPLHKGEKRTWWLLD